MIHKLKILWYLIVRKPKDFFQIRTYPELDADVIESANGYTLRRILWNFYTIEKRSKQ